LDQPVEAFKSSFTRVIAVILACAIPIGVAVIFLDDGLETNIPALLAGVLGGSLAAFALTAIAVAYFKVYVHPDGIRGYNAWGLYHDLAWPDIEKIRPFTLPGLRYIRVYCKNNSSVMWLPLFLTNMSRFKELVSQYAKPDNALNLYLDQNVA